MDAIQTKARPQADISFLVVRNGPKYFPALVQREILEEKVGSSSERKTYQTVYLPKDLPAPAFADSEDAN